MCDSVHHDNDMPKQNIYRSTQSQWLMPQLPSMKQAMSIMAERDAAIQERNMLLNEKNKALEERDLAIRQRDTALRERIEALLERDSAVAELQYRHNSLNSNNSSCPPGCQIGFGIKHVHHPQQYLQNQPHMGNETSYDSQEVTVAEAVPLAKFSTENLKSLKAAQADKLKPVSPNKRFYKKVRRENDNVCKTVFAKSQLECCKGMQETTGGESPKPDWEGQDIGLNQVAFDDATMPAPVCSCTGVYRQCYKWGNGGWQSCCCTTTISLHPLPTVPNRRHARIGGRKMSGGAFSKLLSRLAAEGHDLSVPVDLKDNWAKHGTNRYVTIK